MAEILADLADSIRLRTVDLLGSKGSCVCDLRDAVGIAPNLLSYHLRVSSPVGLTDCGWLYYLRSRAAGGSAARRPRC
jgi:DNA-binding transcriptional ArsR family regulator